MKLQIVAVANGYPVHSYLKRGWEAFLKSSRRYGFEPVVLGWGQPWRGLGSKPKLLKKAIEDGLVSAEHILFVDAFDVWFADNPELILSYFKDQSDYQIIWNAEKNCFPDAEWAVHHPPTDSPFKFFNSGMSIGKTSAYHTIFTQMDVESWRDDFQLADGSWCHVNDQQHIMAKFLFGQCSVEEPKMALDQDCQMFQTLTGVEEGELDIKPGCILNLVTGTTPVAFHANGGSKTDGLMEPILKALDL